MHPAIVELERSHRKPAVSQVQSGDTVRVHQRIREGNKSRIQIFEGVVIRTHRLGSLSATITVRRIASGVGVEKTYLLHSPNVEKVEVMRRAKVRRNFLSYLRERRGKSARLKEVEFDRTAANVAPVKAAAVTEDPLAADEPTDAELTEVDAEEAADVLNDEVVSTDDIAKEENKEAAADEPKSSDDPGDQGDEDVLRKEEAEKGVEKSSA